MKKKASALNYWEGWAILDSSGKCLLVIDSNQNKPIKEKDPSKHIAKIVKGDVDYIVGLIEGYPLTYLDDPVLEKWLPILQKRCSLLYHSNPIFKKKLDSLQRVLKGDLRGRRIEGLKKIIQRDITLFKEIEKRIKENSLEALFNEMVNEEQYKIEIDQIWKVYKAYKSIQGKFLSVLPDRDLFFTFLDICKDNIETPACLVYHEKVTFIKGETQGDTIRVSF